MKYFYAVLLILSLSFCVAASNSKKDSVINQKIEKLNEEIQHSKQEMLEKTIISYQQTNDRLNNYLTFTGVTATMFGVVIALGGIWIGFESWKSQRKQDKAIKTLEDAKSYVENKKSDFNALIESKIGELENDYKKIAQIAKDRLLQDINSETLLVKELAEKKTQEIEEFSIKEKRDEILESLQKRLDFFENIGIPDDPTILLSKAKLLRQKEMFKEAIELLLRIDNIDSGLWEVYWELGYDYSKLGDLANAEQSYQKSISLKDNAASHNNLGTLYEKQNKSYDSLKEFELAIALDPKTKLYHRNKAGILYKLNSIEPAINVYKAIIDIDKTDIKSYQDLINTYEKQSRINEALEYFDLAISINTDKSTELNYLKARLLYKFDKKLEALTLLQNLLSFNYKTEECLQIIAEIKLAFGDKADTLKILDSIQDLNVKNPFPYIKKAEIFFGDDPESAMNIINKGSENINTVDYYLTAARVFAENNANDLAKQLQLKGIEVLKEKISDHKESDIMNLYETLIVVDDYNAARKFITENAIYIKSDSYKIILEFLTLSLKFLENIEVDLTLELEKFRYLKKNYSESIRWNCDDIQYYIKSKGNVEKFKPIFSLIQYLKNEITIEQFRNDFTL